MHKVSWFRLKAERYEDREKWHTLERGCMIGNSFWTRSCGSVGAPGSISRDGNRGVAGGVFNLAFHISLENYFPWFENENNNINRMKSNSMYLQMSESRLSGIEIKQWVKFLLLRGTRIEATDSLHRAEEFNF